MHTRTHASCTVQILWESACICCGRVRTNVHCAYRSCCCLIHAVQRIKMCKDKGFLGVDPDNGEW